MSPITSNLTYAAAIVKQAENCVNCFSLFTRDSVLLKDKLRIIDAKLAKLADAIEAVGVSNHLGQSPGYPRAGKGRHRDGLRASAGARDILA